MLSNPSGHQRFGSFLSLFTFKNTDRNDIVASCVQDVICQKAGRLAQNGPQPSLNVPRCLTNAVLA